MNATASTTLIPAELVPAVAELIILEHFDRKRHVAGHDYGNGQRKNELNRRVDELIRAGLRPEVAYALWEDEALDYVDADELGAAYTRIAEPRIRRIENGSYRNVSRASALKAWDRVRNLVLIRTTAKAVNAAEAAWAEQTTTDAGYEERILDAEEAHRETLAVEADNLDELAAEEAERKADPILNYAGAVRATDAQVKAARAIAVAAGASRVVIEAPDEDYDTWVYVTAYGYDGGTLVGTTVEADGSYEDLDA